MSRKVDYYCDVPGCDNSREVLFGSGFRVVAVNVGFKLRPDSQTVIHLCTDHWKGKGNKALREAVNNS